MDGNEGPWLSGFDDEQRGLLEDLHGEPPARFAICEETEGSEDSRVLGWGLAFDDEAVVVPTNGGLPNPFSGIKGAMRLYGKLRDVRLVWVDSPDGRELT
ncbi:hypothetical protein O7608_15185 [Solwaraspora sp. WMMA2056]|uniref:hypothetical protein n=1 Tax=Solwaraspora sp. WMMA2056 TaxID=3015161 RepID=UPI00259B8128|nr:hypothetical protein [Solwaraspora sp. WMMA2056]WJK43629.1 hypothetical protein O7608_15185 [Solwaraspora sp. WMMA2056]